MKIIDNFFNQQDQDFIEKLLFIEENFPWYLAHTSNYTYEDYVDAIKENVGLPFEKEYHQFVHTLLFDNSKNLIEKINPKKGRAVIFDSNSLHAASPPFNSKIRVVINCTFYKKEEIIR